MDDMDILYYIDICKEKRLYMKARVCKWLK